MSDLKNYTYVPILIVLIFILAIAFEFCTAFVRWLKNNRAANANPC